MIFYFALLLRWSIGSLGGEVPMKSMLFLVGGFLMIPVCLLGLFYQQSFIWVTLPAGSDCYVHSPVAARLRFFGCRRLSRLSCRIALLPAHRMDSIPRNSKRQASADYCLCFYLAHYRHRSRSSCWRDTESDLGSWMTCMSRTQRIGSWLIVGPSVTVRSIHRGVAGYLVFQFPCGSTRVVSRLNA